MLIFLVPYMKKVLSKKFSRSPVTDEPLPAVSKHGVPFRANPE